MRLVIEQLHEVQLIQYDRDGRQGAVDYVFESDTGGGAVEVTTIQDGDATQWFGLLDGGGTIECDTARAWSLTIDLKSKLKDLKKRLPADIAACDRNGADTPLRIPVEQWDADVRWMRSSQYDLRVTDYGVPGIVRLAMPGIAGVVSGGSSDLDREIQDLLTGGRLDSKLAKLRRHPEVAERHLAVGVDFYGSGFGLIDSLLIHRDVVPTYEPPTDLPVTHLWINGGGYAVLTWNRADGWAWRLLGRPE